MSETASAAPTEASQATAMPETAPEAKKYRVKVEGQELEVPEDELIRDYELRRASHMRMQKATEMEKALREEMASSLSDPLKLFQKKGVDPVKWAEDLLLQKLERESWSPEKRELHDAQEQLRQLKEREKAQEEALAKQQQEALTYKAIQEIDGEIGEVLKATGLKPTPRVVARIAEIMLAHLDSADGERLSADKAYGLVKNEMTTEIGEYLGSLPPDQLMQSLPKSVLDAIRKHELDKVRSTPLRHASKSEGPSTARAPRSKKATSTDDFFARLEKKLKR